MAAYVLPPPPDVDDALVKAWLFELYKRNSFLVDSSTDINGLNDVVITSVTDNEVLAYDSSSAKWINQTAQEAGITQLPTETSTNLDDVGHAVNTGALKIQGTVIYNSTTDNPVYAVGNAAADIWVDGAGTTVHSPA